jgi:conjugative relaxase-like TrwC/TraI family protein
VLTITKLKGAEYLISSVADGMEDYYMGAGEAPGVWRGSWAAELGLEGVVEADALRALVDGHDPRSGEDLLVGHRERSVRAIDVTLSCPKSVLLLWAFGSPETSAAVSIAVVEATETALGFVEERAALARRQQGGIRRRVATQGFAVATFAHRTSRAGDPQLHTHCLIPNVVRRQDGTHVAVDANPLHTWAKAAGTVFLNELDRGLTQRLGVAWGPERNGCREMVGFSAEQLRAFSKRTVAIETRLEAAGELAFASKRDRMRADEWASLVTRQHKDKTLTPERLRERWAAEAAAVGLEPGARVDDLVVGRQLAALPGLSEREVFAALVDPATGLCADDSRFSEAHVVERVAATSGGRLTVEEVVELSRRFLASELVVRLAPSADRRRPPEWSSVEHRGLEDRLLAQLQHLAATRREGIDPEVMDAVIASESTPLGRDQGCAVQTLCGAGGAVRVLVAPAGFGKTTALHAAATAQRDAGRQAVALAPTHRAVAELRAAGLEAETVARFLTRHSDEPLRAGTTMIVDETSQLGTRHAAALLDTVAHSPGAQLWCVGDARQAQSVAAGGLAVELERLAADGTIPAVTLVENRRQTDPAEQRALAKLRCGDTRESQTIRTEHGWEHEHASPDDTRHALAAAAVADTDCHGAQGVAVLAVSHADCEDLADRIRAIRAARGELRGPTITGPGWGPDERVYAAGDRILVHANLGVRPDRRVHNGSTGTVLVVGADSVQVLFDDAAQVCLSNDVIGGCRTDGSPNVSHAWARTVDGAQGGTWRQVHLLGTPALDRLRAYVGQSRGEDPTHTWNTRPDADHPASLLADQRTASEAVADAMDRADPKTFAAADDPWIVDRALRTERDQHAAIVATRPPEGRADLGHARQTLERAADEHYWATRSVEHYQRERARLGPFVRLRRGGRDDIARADDALGGANDRLARAAHALYEARARLDDCEAAVAARTAWDRDHAWRVDRIAELDHTLAHHWADITLRAVRADDPLAFGIEPLRDAAATYHADLQRLARGLPDDRHHALAQAETDRRRHENDLNRAEQRLAEAPATLEHVGQRHWGRRHKTAIQDATSELRAAETDLARRRDVVSQSVRRGAEEQRAVHAWTTAMTATADPRTRLDAAIRDLDDALDATRAQRVAAAAVEPTSKFWRALGPPPTTRGGLAAWCGIAEQLETWTDHHPASRQRHVRALRGRSHPILGPCPGVAAAPQWDEVAALASDAKNIIDIASRLDPDPSPSPLDDCANWHPAVDTAQRVLTVQRLAPAVDRGLGIEL